VCLSVVSLPPYAFLIRLTTYIHTHNRVKARKLVRLPSDKCCREEDSHADIGTFLSLSFPSSCCKLLLDRSLPPARAHSCTACIHVCVVRVEARAHLLTYRKETPTYVPTRTDICTHAYRHSYSLRLILLEATDAPISVRVSFVIRENVNQSPGPRRLLLLRGSSFLLRSLRTCTCMCVRAYALYVVRVDMLALLYYLLYGPTCALYVSSIIQTAKDVRRLNATRVATNSNSRTCIYIYVCVCMYVYTTSINVLVYIYRLYVCKMHTYDMHAMDTVLRASSGSRIS